MKTKKIAHAPRRMQLSEGVGFDATPCEDGYGFKRHPAVAVAVHPIRGIQIHGPFVTAAAARAWIGTEGDAELMNGWDDVRSVQWHVETLDVPRSYC